MRIARGGVESAVTEQAPDGRQLLAKGERPRGEGSGRCLFRRLARRAARVMRRRGSRCVLARNRSSPGGRNTRGRHRSDAVPREAETFRPFSPPHRRAHPPGPERLPLRKARGSGNRRSGDANHDKS